MILSDSRIREEIDKGRIVVEPFDPQRLGSNSYDVRLGRNLLMYDPGLIDAAKNNEVFLFEIPDEGTILYPGRIYLGVTEEYTESHDFVPFLDGKSSAGRLGIFIHATAGRGDVGFCGHWTMEISVVQCVRVYPKMPIGQIYWMTVEGVVDRPYGVKSDAKYQGARTSDPKPISSRMWENFLKEEGT